MPASPAILALGLVGALIVFFMAWRSPVLALAVWIIESTVLSEYILLPNAPTLHVHLSRVLLTCMGAGLAAGWIPRTKPPNTPVLPAVLIMLLTIWTIITAAITGTLFRVDGTRNLSVFLTGFVVPGMVLYFCRYFTVSLKVVRQVCTLLTALTAYMVLTAFFEHFHINILVFPPYILDQSLGIHTERARGPIVNAAENGGIMSILLLVALHWVLYTFSGAMRWVNCFLVLILGAVALYFTETRGPWVAFLAGLGIMLLHKRCRSLVMALGGLGGLALTVFLIISAATVGGLAKKDPLPQRSDNTADTADFRMDLYRESVRPFEDHPLIGWGLGTFTDEDYLFDGYGGSLTITTAVLHDTLDAITLESGIPGGLLWLGFLISLTVLLFKLRRASNDDETRDFYVMCVAGLAAHVICGSFVDNRYLWQQTTIAFFLGGLGLGLYPLKHLRAAKPAAPPVRTLHSGSQQASA